MLPVTGGPVNAASGSRRRGAEWEIESQRIDGVGVVL